MDTFKINFILIMALMNIVYTCFSIIRGYVTAIYVMFYWKISFKHFFRQFQFTVYQFGHVTVRTFW